MEIIHKYHYLYYEAWHYKYINKKTKYLDLQIAQ